MGSKRGRFCSRVVTSVIRSRARVREPNTLLPVHTFYTTIFFVPGMIFLWLLLLLRTLAECRPRTRLLVHAYVHVFVGLSTFAVKCLIYIPSPCVLFSHVIFLARSHASSCFGSAFPTTQTEPVLPESGF